MLSYQHSYHAGNHADALKHIVLGDLVAAMMLKEAPLFLFDAFASRGIYNLDSAEALKNREFDSGIGKLWPLRHGHLPEGVSRWFNIIEGENSDGSFTRLPGSTALLAAMLRDTDRLAACDLHPQEFDALREGFKNSRRIALHKRDAFEAVPALLPPVEKRGLIFLDPSYENKEEYKKVARTISDACTRFRAGVYVIWYPLLPAGRHLDLFNALKRSGIRKILRVELDGKESFPEMQMYGSGLLIVNPPWHAEQNMKRSLDWLHQHLIAGNGLATFNWLVPE
ncbi:23S rRNA (adenine(2030)-N(6))-methyltransferase RlmJ [Mariprofundus erugo]|uniref:23S rRNA (adenine(2030)-N(6))-methyltransferase RlmJ n=1 Tax=Mariprofundus erugo TaxID=2528639 RepID=UPI0010FE502D|nr:23S rRNA (adenine(2030)-N(6))-methyltransferase RlmJ [Mariprofundus erugo]TLS77262.1 23S rRNA (adenine(2030)-N(6))-methyltransferase RlmJ [Mariprofundus erugo]